jgi:rubrerythrin
MPQTNPFHSLVPGRKLSDQELARSIRLNIESELDAINLYAAHIEASDNEEAKAILRHIMDEEKEHMALFNELLKRLDPEQRKHAEEAPEKYRLIVSGAPEEVVEAVGKGGHAALALAEEPAVPKKLTVGSLTGAKR